MNLTHSTTLYLDTNIFIYALEGYPMFEKTIQELFNAIDKNQVKAVTSELTIAEALVKPFEVGDPEKIILYEQALQQTESFSIVPISRSILREAAKLRAEVNLKLPDAIHLATASQQKCDVFISNDKSIRSVSGIKINSLYEIGKTLSQFSKSKK